MSIVQKKLICFHLVDTNRQPIDSGTVYLTSYSVVDEFCEAVMNKYADSLLKDVAAPDLEVFGNKASLQKPLDPFHSLGELGKREDPLIVVVPPPVWFQLVGADCLPFKGCSIDALTLPRSSSIVEFCKAVKAENPNVLSLIDPSQLTVFENRTALKADSPLRGSTFIEKFGISENDPLMVLVPSLSAKSPIQSILNQYPGDVKVLLANLKAIPCPSTFARPKMLIEWKLKTNNPILCHRPQSPSIPISAKCGVFSQFLQDADHVEVDQCDIDFVLEMCMELAEPFADEEKRMEVLYPLLSKWLGNDTGLYFAKMQYGKSIGDGGFYKDCTPYVLLEAKNELGLGGCCPYVKAAAVYGTYFSEKCKDLLKQSFSKSANPCFIIYVAGPFLGIAGVLVHESNVICDPLTPMFTLMYEPWNR
jgi:hypothetical protein